LTPLLHLRVKSTGRDAGLYGRPEACHYTKKAARMSGLFNFLKTPGQAAFGAAGRALAAFLALTAIFLRLW
jgi:hypothetical protein